MSGDRPQIASRIALELGIAAVLGGADIACSNSDIILLSGRLDTLLTAARRGQFDDLEGPAHRILMDEDRTSNE